MLDLLAWKNALRSAVSQANGPLQSPTTLWPHLLDPSGSRPDRYFRPNSPAPQKTTLQNRVQRAISSRPLSSYPGKTGILPVALRCNAMHFPLLPDLRGHRSVPLFFKTRLPRFEERHSATWWVMQPLRARCFLRHRNTRLRKRALRCVIHPAPLRAPPVRRSMRPCPATHRLPRVAGRRIPLRGR